MRALKNQQRHPVDISIGKRIRALRLIRGLSQSELGQNLGVTFQQIQKYENAKNRVSASRLFEFAKILECNIAYFYEDVEQQPIGQQKNIPNVLLENITTKEGVQINKAFASIKSIEVKRGIVNLAQTLTGDE